MSQVTSHILDTTLGKPAANIMVIMFKTENDVWTEIARGKTNNDGRLADLLKTNDPVTPGIYQLRFFTKEYFNTKGLETLYPFVEIVFEIENTDHYHIPLLLNPYGYSTYRGS